MPAASLVEDVEVALLVGADLQRDRVFLALAQLALVDVGGEVDGAPVHDAEVAAFSDVFGRGGEGCCAESRGGLGNEEGNELELHLEGLVFGV